MTMSAKQLIQVAAACTECGWEHRPRTVSKNRTTWAARDGHAYRPRIYAMTNQSAEPVLTALRKLADQKQ